ncbi:hypothetical protein STEG23_014732 [Scotinomys teguina]
MARKAGQGKEEEESRARQQAEKTPVRDEEKRPACDGRGHHVVEQGNTHMRVPWRVQAGDKAWKRFGNKSRSLNVSKEQGFLTYKMRDDIFPNEQMNDQKNRDKITLRFVNKGSLITFHSKLQPQFHQKEFLMRRIGGGAGFGSILALWIAYVPEKPVLGPSPSLFMLIDLCKAKTLPKRAYL